MKKVWKVAVMSLFTSLLALPMTAFASAPDVHLKVGEKREMKTVVQLPELDKEAVGLKVKWLITNPKIAKIDSKEQITALSKGTTHAKAYVEGHPGVFEEFDIVVESTVSAVDIIEEPMSLTMGKSVQLNANVLPEEAVNKNVRWSSSNRSVASVSSKGELRALGVGKTTITAVTEDGGFKDSVEITVTSPITGLEVLEKEVDLPLGDQLPVPVVLNSNTDDAQTILYQSSDKSILTVSSKGIMSGLKEGSTTIQLKTSDGQFTESIKVNVTSDIEELHYVDQNLKEISNVSLEPGQSFAGYVVSDLKNLESLKKYRPVFTSSNPDVVKVVYGGVLKAMKEGSATITVTLPQELSPVTTSVTVDVVPSVTEIILDKEKLELEVGEKEPLRATVLPTQSVNKTLTWTSANAKVATVNNGMVRGVSAGTTTIYAKSFDGKVVAECQVTITSVAEGISNAPETIELYIGEQFKFTPTVLPDTTLLKSMGFSIPKEYTSILKVTSSSKGEFVLTGLKQGTVQVQLFTKDGNHKHTISVNVKPTPIDIVIVDENGEPINTQE